MRDRRVFKKSHTRFLPLDGPSQPRPIYINEITYLFWNGSCFLLHQNTGCLVQGDPFYQMISSSSLRGWSFQGDPEWVGCSAPPSSDPQGSKLRVTIWPFFAPPLPFSSHETRTVTLPLRVQNRWGGEFWWGGSWWLSSFSP